MNRKSFIICTTLLVLALVGLIVGLTLGLRSREQQNGNTTPLPPRPTTTTPTGTPEPTSETPKSASGQYRFAAVAADATECSTIGVEIMAKQRGSAVDAAVAAMLCVGVLNLHSTGIGGGHFMTIYDTPRGETEKKVVTIDGRERAPLAAHRDMYVNDSTASVLGGLAVGVPGEVAGLHKAWQMFGRVPWKDLVAPAIKLCQEGHRVTPSAATAVTGTETVIRNDANLRELLIKENGETVKAGDILKRPKLAATLQKIADDPFAFYNGSLVQDIVEDIKEYKGIITAEDLNNYTALVKEPLNVTLSNGNYTVYGVRPPASGAVYQYILSILNGFHFGPESYETLDKKVLFYHRMLEAFKFAYAKRSALGDENFLGQELQELLRNMTSQDYAEAIRLRINDEQTQNVSYYDPAFAQEVNFGTAHLSVLAPDGSAVGITGSINLYFGAKLRGNRTGIFFNDEMDDFSTPGTRNSFGVPASPSNFIAPGKRPQSSMCPTLILDDRNEVVHITGAAGGTRITTQTSFVTMMNLWLRKSLLEAVDHPRIHHQLVPNEISYEQDFPKDILEGLIKKGHMTRPRTSYNAVVVPITNTCNHCSGSNCDRTKCLHAVTDFRKPSAPDGY